MMKHPDIFLTTGKVVQITEHFKLIVKFRVVKVEVHPEHLRKTTVEKIKTFNQKEKFLENLQPGDTVIIDVGPPNFVRSKLNEIDASSEVKFALTKPAEVLGLLDTKTAIIQYENSLRYSIPKKYLTVPDESEIEGGTEILDLDAMKEIQDIVTRGIMEVDQNCKVGEHDPPVEIWGTAKGRPPCIDIKVNSENAEWSSLLSWLQTRSGWKIKVICEGQILISGMKNFKSEVILGISFEDDEFEIGYERGAVSERGDLVNVEVDPICDNSAEVINEQPNPHSLEDFRYFRLHDPRLGRDVYFPYVFHGPRREPAEYAQENQMDRTPENVNIFNLYHPKIGSLNNLN